MTNTPFLALIIVAIGGAVVAVQAPVNAALGRAVDSTIVAAAVSFGVGFVVLCLAALVAGDGGGFTKLSGLSFWLLTGGVLGAFYVWSAVWGVTTLGVLTTVSALLLGQLLAALILDYFGPLGLPTRDITPTRLLAAAMVAGGLFLSRY